MHKRNPIIGEPIGEQNVRLTIGLSAVFMWDHGRSSFLAAHHWTVAILSFYTLFMPGMSGNI